MRRVLAKHPIRAALSFGLTIAICYWLYDATNWSEVGHQLRTLRHWEMAVLSVGAFFLQIVLRAIRWGQLLPAASEKISQDGYVPTWRLLCRGIMVGNFGNYFLPLRAGEFLRPYVVAAEMRTSFMTCLASTIVERFFDLFTVLVSFGWVLVVHRTLPPTFYNGAYAIAVLAVGILLFVVVCARFPNRLQAVIAYLLRFLPTKVGAAVEKLVNDLVRGTRMLREGRRLAAVLFLSLLIWIATFWQYQLLLYCFELPATISFAMTISVMIALAVAAPSSPGFIGLFEFACIGAFALHGEGKAIAVSYAIVAHSIMFLIIGAYGFVLMVRSGWLASRMESKREAMRH